MKKLLFILPILLLSSCAKEPTEKLPDPPAGSYTVFLDGFASHLTSEDSAAPISVTLVALEDERVTYELEIGAPAYLKEVSDGTNTYQEMVFKSGAYIKSVSNYQVSKIACDIYEGKGINYDVYNNAEGTGEALEEYASSLEPTYPEDSGAVYEYDIENTSWSIRNNSSYKPAFYAVYIYFEIL